MTGPDPEVGDRPTGRDPADLLAAPGGVAAPVAAAGATAATTTTDAAGDGGAAPSTSRGVRHAGLSFASSVVVGLLSAVVVSRIYGIEVVGEFALASTPAAMLAQFSSVGEQLALIRALAAEKASSTRVISVFLVVLSFSSLLTAAIALVVGAISLALLLGPVDRPELVLPAAVLMLAYVLFGNPSWNTDRLLSVLRSTGALLVGRLIDLLLLLALSVTLPAVLGATTWTLVWATVSALAAGLCLRVVQARRVVTGRPTAAGLREALVELPALLRFGARTTPGLIANGVASHLGTWLIGAVASVSALGAYSRANNIAVRINEAGYRLNEVILPVLSQAVHEQRYDDAGRVFQRWRLVSVLVLIGASAALAGAAEGLLAVFGPGFSTAWVALGLLVVAYSTSVVNMLHADYLLALGHPGTASRATLVRAVVVLTATAPATVWFGITGTAAAVLASHLAELAALTVLVQRRARRHAAAPASPPWARVLLAAGIAFGAARLVDLQSGALLVALAAGALGLSAYLATAVVLRLVPRGAWAHLRSAVSQR